MIRFSNNSFCFCFFCFGLFFICISVSVSVFCFGWFFDRSPKCSGLFMFFSISFSVSTVSVYASVFCFCFCFITFPKARFLPGPMFRMFRMFRLDVSISVMVKYLKSTAPSSQSTKNQNFKRTKSLLSLSYNISSMIRGRLVKSP